MARRCQSCLSLHLSPRVLLALPSFMITMSSPVNTRDYAATGYESSSREPVSSAEARGDVKHHNYAWPTQQQRAASQQYVQSQQAIQTQTRHQGSPSEMAHYPSRATNGNAGSPSRHPTHAMPSSSSQSSNLRVSTDVSRGAGPSRSRQDAAAQYGQQQQPPSNRMSSASTMQPMSPTLNHSRQTSQATTVGPSVYGGGRQMAHTTDVSPTPMRPPLRSRVFGLTKDMRPQTDLVDPAFFPGGVVPPEAATLAGAETSKEQPTFSVELLAPSFDHRGYPVYGGRAAVIRGTVRMPKREQSDVLIKVSIDTWHCGATTEGL